VAELDAGEDPLWRGEELISVAVALLAGSDVLGGIADVSALRWVFDALPLLGALLRKIAERVLRERKHALE
jgi:hypothetical protein